MGERNLYALVNYKREKHTWALGLGVRTDRETAEWESASPPARSADRGAPPGWGVARCRPVRLPASTTVYPLLK